VRLPPALDGQHDQHKEADADDGAHPATGWALSESPVTSFVTANVGRKTNRMLIQRPTIR
jgi:hypothetical protein